MREHTASCRLCDQKRDKMHNVFSKNSTGQQILHLIKDLLPIIIFRNDPLSKEVCSSCLNHLEVFANFKRNLIETSNKQITKLSNLSQPDKTIQLYLSCNESQADSPLHIPTKATVATSTADLPATAELELCTAPDRTKRKRSAAFYNELDSLTSSSPFESCDSELDDAPKPKRRKFDGRHKASASATQRVITRKLYRGEEELRYYPLSLMTLCLNVINKRHNADFEPNDFYTKVIRPRCATCHLEFTNLKLLALHEVEHINIELGDKVDVSLDWHESRDDAHVRNKWLKEIKSENNENLLIPIGSETNADLEPIELVSNESPIVLHSGHAYVNDVPLVNYTKDQRRSFYRSIKVGTHTRKVCDICKYSFRDNWSIEAHYFSLACAFTCHYCGLRFNKYRSRFEPHVNEHKEKGEEVKPHTLFSSNKSGNFGPHVVPPKKFTYVPPLDEVDKERERERERAPPVLVAPAAVKVRGKPGPKPRVKTEPEEEHQPGTIKPSNAASNQAYFCRKCYKVFFKLDEFSVHSRGCELGHSRGFVSPAVSANGVKLEPKLEPKADLSPAGRPIRQAVRDSASYKERAESPGAEKDPAMVCPICEMCFESSFARNSHMRVHKTGWRPGGRPEEGVKEERKVEEKRVGEKRGREEAVAAVSITPISKNPNQKPTINANIMKLVQSNPHLTIKPNEEATERVNLNGSSSSQSSESEGVKNYKCSSCGVNFSNKSHLYFHKKNNCGGSQYPCPFCKKRFGTESAYSSHIFYSHPE